MSAIKGRSKRRLDDEPTSILYARVRPQVKGKANAVAAALGIPIAEYVERLIEQDQLDETGAPLWAYAQTRADDEEELPLARTA